MKKIFPLLAALFFIQLTNAQDILLTIDNHQISKDEFLRIYNKNSSITLEEKKSVDEYLDLFINYKLKVIEAQNLGYDTVGSFIKEMDGYRSQLAKPYIENTNITDSIVEVAYERLKTEVNTSHILLKLDKNATPRDTAKVYNKILGYRERLIKGEPWDELILKESPNPEDLIGGDLGWFGIGRMVYPFETASYTVPVGSISMPVRTEFGYHLIKVNGRRENRGEISLSHIMTLIPQNATEFEISAARERIDKAHSELENGMPWDSVVVKYSEHRASIKRMGSLGWLKTGTVPDELLSAAFSVPTGEYSQPIKTSFGYHIVRNDEIRPASAPKNADDFRKSVLQNSYVRGITEGQLLESIKKDYGFTFNNENLEELYVVADSGLYRRTWSPEVARDMRKVVFVIGDSSYTQYDVAKYVATNRLYARRELQSIVYNRAIDYMNGRIKAYGIAQLPAKYPEYKYLLDEYHDGILLFNLTEDKVWKRAVEDSAGLVEFYNNLPEKYRWESRVLITKYSYADSTLTGKLLKLAKKRMKKNLSAQDLSALLCPGDSVDCVNFSEVKYEKDDNSISKSINWKAKSYIKTKDKNGNVLYFVESVLPSQEKTLSDARGLYTADYQNHLEKLWIEELRKKYSISINDEVLQKVRQEDAEVTSGS